MATFIQKYFKGDKPLWSFILVLAIFSFLPVYSASSNLVYTVGTGTVFSHLLKHAFFLFVGIVLIFVIQKVDYRYFGIFALTAVILLFFYYYSLWFKAKLLVEQTLHVG